MGKKHKFKITLITVVAVIFSYILLTSSPSRIIRKIRFTIEEKEWEKEDPSGQLVNGLKNGIWTTYYLNGQLERKENYQNDTLHGMQLIYYPTGQLHISRTFLLGKQIDSTTWYHSNGKLYKQEFRDSLGLRQGQFKIFYSNGELSQVAYSKNNKLDGKSYSFYDDGKHRSISIYDEGKRIGTWYEFSNEGDTVKVEEY